MYPEMSVADYRAYADLRVEAINRALDGIPTDRVRLHICWGSGHGPHTNDIPLEDIVDLVLKVKARLLLGRGGQRAPRARVAGVAGRQAARRQVAHARRRRPRHRRRRASRGRRRPPGALREGRRPRERHRRHRLRPGRSRVGHGEIAWAKLRMLVEGARLASQELWS